MKINALSVVKFAVSAVVGMGTGKIVSKIIKDHIRPETLIDKAAVAAATFVIAAMATEATKDYTNNFIDETVEGGKKIVKAVKDNKAIVKLNRGEITLEESGLDPETVYKDSDGVWRFLKPTGPDESLEQKLARLNRGETTFDAEGMIPENFRKNNQGDWEPYDNTASK